jgi:hypothetical protein
MPRPSLPDALPGDEVTWNPGGGGATISRAPAKVSLKSPGAKQERQSSSGSSSSEHALLSNARSLFLAGRLSSYGNYLKPAKRLLPDVVVTKGSLDFALAFANALFLALEKRGHRVLFASPNEHVMRADIDTRDVPTKRAFHDNLWSPARQTILYLNGTPIGLTIFELTEATSMRYVNGKYVREKDYVAPKSARLSESHWRSTQDIPAGRLCLQAYTSYYDAKWEKRWKEPRQGDFLKDIGSLVRGIEQCQAEAAKTIELGRAHAEAEDARHEAMRRKWQEEESERRCLKALTESRSELAAMLEAWERADRMARFIEKLESQASSLDSEQRDRLKVLIEEAQTVMGAEPTLEEFLAWKPPRERQ